MLENYKNIFITGANGWLGKSLIRVLTEINHNANLNINVQAEKIFATDIDDSNVNPNINFDKFDIQNQNKLKNFFQNAENGVLFHLAGIIHPKKVSHFYDINFEATKRLIQIAHENNIKKIVIVSSNSPCGNNPHSEHLFDEHSPYNPYMHYGKSKCLMEKFSLEYAKKTNCNIVIIRAPWFYGPNQPARQLEFFRMIRDGKMPVIGDSSNFRSMVYVDNLVQGLLLATKEEIKNEIFWIADENPYTMSYILDTIRKVLKSEYNIESKKPKLYIPSFVCDIAMLFDFLLQSFGVYHQKIHVLSEMNKNIACDISHAKKRLNYKPKISLYDGIKLSLKDQSL